MTGIITKGGEYGWVKSYSVLFSHDNVIWNKIVDETGKPMEFLANVDSENIKKNLFKQAINARYVKIQPIKWYGAIEMKIEPIGCYLPYRELILYVRCSMKCCTMLSNCIMIYSQTRWNDNNFAER